MNYEIIANGEVVNTIAASPEFMATNFADGAYRLATADLPPVIIDPCEWLIDIGPLYDRFGAAKMAILTSPDAAVKAIIQDLNVRKWVDLKRPDVAQAFAYIGSVVAAVTPALQAAILTTPVSQDENRALRKQYFA